jgi:alpha-beta hydrolase superfamily lysophospholipase
MKTSVGLLLLMSLAACTPSEQAFNPAGVTPTLSRDVFLSVDGEKLPVRSWLPKKKPKAILVALHGFNDYSNGFVSAGTYFKKHGIATYAYDQRGFGEASQTGVWAGEENLKRDAITFVQTIHKQHPKTPIFLMGESMGGAVAILASSGNELPPLAGIILIAPAVWGGDSMPLLNRSMLWTFAHIIPDTKMTGKDLKIMATNNIPMLRRLSADPLVIKSTRVDAVYGISNLMDSAYAQADKVKPPILLLYGGQDQVIPPKPVESVVRRLPKPFDVGYYEEGYHMLTRDIQGESVLADIADWIAKHPTRAN